MSPCEPKSKDDDNFKMKKKSNNYAKLSMIETKLYQICWCFIVLFGFYKVFKLSKKQGKIFQ